MDYFDEADAELFIGREALTDKLTRRVLALVSKTTPEKIRFFAVVGASGSGKSSLVRAGLVSALRWNKACAGWPIHILTPTTHPLESLAVVLSSESLSLASAAALIDNMGRDQRALSLFFKRQLKVNSGTYALLVIDQIEELFSLCHSEEERQAFIGNLMTCAVDEAGQVIVVVTLRSDFYTHCSVYPQLRQALAAHQEYIGAMSSEEMRRAVEEPTLRGQWEFEPGLVDLILHDVGTEPGALPLLSHALLETWQRRHGRSMTLSGYSSSGGVRGAIAETAEAVFTDQFTAEQQAIARRIFLRLTELGDETSSGDTRRRATIKELIHKREETEVTWMVIQMLANARLVTTSDDSVQVAHEALIREWPTLRGWLEENRDNLRLHRQLTEAAAEWDVAGRQPDLLYRGARLVQAREWADSHADDLNTLEGAFLAAAVSLSDDEAAAREAQHQRELEAAQRLANAERMRADEGMRSSRRLRNLLIVLSSLGVLAVVLAIFAFLGWQRSTAQTAINQSAGLVSAAQQANQSGKGDLALTLALEAVKGRLPSVESLEVLRSIAFGPGTRALIASRANELRAVSLSPDGKLALAGSCTSVDAQGACLIGELILWDFSSGKELHRWAAHYGWISTIAFSPDGQKIISGGDDGSIFIWDITGKLIGQLLGHRQEITSLASMPGTTHLLSGSVDGYLIMHDTSDGKVLQRFQFGGSPLTAFSVSADGQKAVSVYQNGDIKVWDLAAQALINTFPGNDEDIQAIAINPDGSWILMGDSSTPQPSLNMLSTSNGVLIDQLKLDCVPKQIKLLADGSTAFIICSNTIIQVDIPDWSVYQRFNGHGEIFNAISITPDGLYGLTGANDGTLRAWNLGDQIYFQTVPVAVNYINSLAITPDGNYLVINGYYEYALYSLVKWDIAQKSVVKRYVRELAVSQGGTAISPDGSYLTAAGVDKSYEISNVFVWNLAGGGVDCLFNDFIRNASAVAFTPDSSLVLVGSQVPGEPVGQLSLYDIKTCKEVLKFETNEDVSSVAINPDGRYAASGSGFLGRVILWEVATGKELQRYAYSETGPVWAVAFGPDGKTVLGTGLGEIYAWDIVTGNLIQRYSGLSVSPRSLAVSPDGKYVLSGTTTGELILWDYVTGEELHQLNTRLAISDMVFSPDSKTAYVASLDNKLIYLSIDEKPLPELLQWIQSNRYVRQLTCEEKEQYRVNPQCTK